MKRLTEQEIEQIKEKMKVGGYRDSDMCMEDMNRLLNNCEYHNEQSRIRRIQNDRNEPARRFMRHNR